jgi:hypothetical protein
MLAELCQPSEDRLAVAGDMPLESHRAIDFAMNYRSKDSFEPVTTLPRWTGWALVVWTVGSAAAYAAILAHWWE